jgi:hypothetical protein
MGDFENIEKRVYERYLFELMKGWAEEYKRRDDNPRFVVEEVQLVNPGTSKAVLRLRLRDPSDNRETVQGYGIYGYPFYREDGTREDAGQAVGDVLMWARGS